MARAKRSGEGAASEDFWLGHAGRTNTVPVAWSNGLQIGDSVTITSKGREHVLRVDGIARMPTRLDGKLGSSSMVIVTAREPGRDDGLAMRLVVDQSDTFLEAKPSSDADRNL